MEALVSTIFLTLIFLVATLATLLLIVAIVAIAYVSLRIRDAKSDHPDPELGLKTAFWFLCSLGIVIFHIGLVILTTILIQNLDHANPAPPQPPNPFQPVQPKAGVARAPRPADPESWSDASRVGWALVLGGGAIALGFYLVCVLGTNDRAWPTVRRLFLGGRIVMAGMASIVAFLAALIIQFMKESQAGGALHASLGSLAICLPSLAIHLFLFRWGGNPSYHVPTIPATKPRHIRRYDEDEEHTEADLHVEPPTEEEEKPRRRPHADDEDTPKPGDDEERPRRRRPRDDDE